MKFSKRFEQKFHQQYRDLTKGDFDAAVAAVMKIVQSYSFNNEDLKEILDNVTKISFSDYVLSFNPLTTILSMRDLNDS